MKSDDTDPPIQRDFRTEVRTGGRNDEPERSRRTQEIVPHRPVQEQLQGPREMSRPVLLVAAVLVLAIGATVWFWSLAGQGAEYVQMPGNGHVHTAFVLPAPGSQGSSLWLGTHEGLYIKALGGNDGPNSPSGWRKMVAPLRSTDVMALGAARRSGGPVYAAGHNVGVQRSDDGGATWRQLMPGAPTRDVHALAVDPENSDRVYLWAEVLGLITTSNGGATWETPGDNSLKNAVQVTGLAVSHPAGSPGSVLYAGSNLGLFISRDNGASWTPLAGLAGEQPIYSLLAVDKPKQQGEQEQKERKDIYAGTATSILHSPDGGEHWEELKGAAQLGGVPGLAYDASAGQPGRLLAVTAGSEVYQSRNSGMTWNPVP